MKFHNYQLTINDQYTVNMKINIIYLKFSRTNQSIHRMIYQLTLFTRAFSFKNSFKKFWVREGRVNQDAPTSLVIMPKSCIAGIRVLKL